MSYPWQYVAGNHLSNNPFYGYSENEVGVDLVLIQPFIM